MSFIGLMCQRGSVTRWASWCTGVFTVRHLGTSPTISSQLLISLLSFVCVLQSDTSSSYLAVDSTHTAVGRFRLLVRRSGTRCLTTSEIRRAVPTVLNSFLTQSWSVSTNVTSALGVSCTWYALYKSTFYLLTYITTQRRSRTVADSSPQQTDPRTSIVKWLQRRRWSVIEVVQLSSFDVCWPSTQNQPRCVALHCAAHTTRAATHAAINARQPAVKSWQCDWPFFLRPRQRMK